MIPEKILVTGGTGFIGRQVVRLLLQEGMAVRLLVRSMQKARNLFGETVEVVEGDLCDKEVVRRACLEADQVMHIGGIYRFGFPYRRTLFDVNVEGTRNLLDAAWSARVKRFVHVSTAGLLQSRGLPLTEKDFPDKPMWGCPYKQSKWHAEKLALEYYQKGLPVVIANPTCPVGAEDEHPTPTGAIVRDYLAGNYLFSSRTGINVIAVEDLALGLLAVMRKGRPGERYLLGDHDLWLDDLLQGMEKHCGVKPPRFHLPWPLILLFGLLSEAVSIPFREWHFPLSLESALHARRVQFFDLSKARTELGWSPVLSLDEALKRAVRWHLDREVPQIKVSGSQNDSLHDQELIPGSLFGK